MAISCSYSATATWLALLTSSSFTVAFVVPPPNIQQSSASVLVNLYQEEGAPYPTGGRKLPLVNLNNNANNTNNGSSRNIDEVEDVVGGGTLGDIMATNSTISKTTIDNNNVIHDGLVTREGGELNTRFKGCNFTPMERIALTANGNLQRIFSSYYDSPVHVYVDYCTRRRRRQRKKSSNENNNSQQQVGSFNYSSLGLYDTHKLAITQTTDNELDCSKNNDDDDAIWDRIVHIQVHNQTICKATSIIHVQSPSCVQLIEDGSVGLGQMFRYLNKLLRVLESLAKNPRRKRRRRRVESLSERVQVFEILGFGST